MKNKITPLKSGSSKPYKTIGDRMTEILNDQLVDLQQEHPNASIKELTSGKIKYRPASQQTQDEFHKLLSRINSDSDFDKPL